MKTTLSAKMITFAHGCFGLWQKQSNQKGLTPAIGASPDFVCSAQKSFIGQQYKIIQKQWFKERALIVV